MASNDQATLRAARAAARDARLEGLGIIALVVGLAAIVLYFVPGYDERAWIPALAAILLGAVALGLKVARRRFAITAMMLGVVAFSWSLAMVLFGSAR